MNAIIIAAVSVTVIGFICAVVLSIASKIMAVKADERVAQVQKALPGSNCGACGFPGCSGYAEALVSNTGVKNNLCTPGGAAVAEKLSAILGTAAGSVTRKTAVVLCGGDCDAQQRKMDYRGIQTCTAAKQLFAGEGACAFGCLGYGDCKTVCPADAVCMVNGLARINAARCTGCGLCVKACPNSIILIESAEIPVLVLCRNIEKGAVTRKKCTNGCIACGKCVRECPDKAITLEDNLAVIDYGKCNTSSGSDGCKHCVEVCITKCIKNSKPTTLL